MPYLCIAPCETISNQGYIIYHIKKGAFKAPNPQRKVQVLWFERCPKSD